MPGHSQVVCPTPASLVMVLGGAASSGNPTIDKSIHHRKTVPRVTVGQAEQSHPHTDPLSQCAVIGGWICPIETPTACRESHGLSQRKRLVKSWVLDVDAENADVPFRQQHTTSNKSSTPELTLIPRLEPIQVSVKATSCSTLS